ncbi:A disintegrin and metalloproteinase with thrombospondin motifs adt-1-like isoform X12 [Dreissena polymorpha]|uniref:A disintegrin and metalloproteinase with thrombospondin motifs adt-1-like isoform X12 n=1 Tax=Dreissena polymorpha TaxID=45954 RepID=UPI0022643BFD|nr:A disintegrin and metalloproteinase with thrombospondin motifs adt-1-like isoform X12 [Dreissena polymorpha]
MNWIVCFYEYEMMQKVFVIIFAIILDVTSGSNILQKKFLLDGQDNSCDFNADTLCSWRNVRDLKAGEISDDFDWTLYGGSTPTDDTGPSFDHTTGTEKGKYAFIESSAPRVLGERAWMESPEIHSLGQSVVCFRFWYHKFGDKMGNLSVYHHSHGPRPGILVWSDVTDHGDRWLSAQVPLPANVNFRIILEGVIGDGYLGDIAVDDVSVGNGYCLVTPPEASRSNVTPPPVTSAPSPIDGTWGIWTTWSVCSVSCGAGNQSRSRSCDFRAGVRHGADCLGDSTENRTCNTVPCPVDGVWTTWSSWTTCPVTCGGGTGTRNRTCQFPPGVPHGHPCMGKVSETRDCSTNLCPVDGVWTTWSSWTTCRVTCGGGTGTRNRTCQFPPGVPHGHPCMGKVSETRDCSTNLCPVDGVWTTWSSWTTCTVTCGGGTGTRNRTCQFQPGAPHGHACTGLASENRTCNAYLCPVDGVWTTWSSWTTCTVTCGGGTGTRNRTCQFQPGAPHGHACTGLASENRTCNAYLCPVDGVWTTWSSWTTCTVTCGGGTGTRNRTCQFPLGVPHGHDCTGLASENRTCNAYLCPVDGVWDTWSSWTTCTVSCGGGTVTRNRTCNFVPGAPHGHDCTGLASENRTCNANLCPVDGVWTTWSSWTTCTVSCGGGTGTRKRTCVFVPGAPHGHDCTGLASENRTCNANLCPVDGVWDTWSSWTTCTVSCGGGTVTRNRTCNFAPGAPHGHDCTGLASENRTCNANLCPVDGVWDTWSSWTTCTVSCGGGTVTRNRTCNFVPGAPHGHDCTGLASENRTCNANLCPVDGVWDTWSSWTTCSVSCGGGTGTRNRTCNFVPGAPHGHDCTGLASENRTCNANLCPVDGVWDTWSSWTTCTVSCGDGTVTRNRTCNFVPGAPHGHDCTGLASENRTCNANLCPVDGLWSAWLSWNTCSVSCGGGSHARQRACTFDPVAPHGMPCVGDGSQNDTCNTGMCPVDGVWSDWSAWTTCSVTCGKGYKSRDRNCQYLTQNAPHGRNCNGNGTEAEFCKLAICPDSKDCYFCDDNSSQGFVTNATSCITDTVCKTDEVCFAENYYRPGTVMGYRFNCKAFPICRFLMQNVFQYLAGCFGHYGDPSFPDCVHESQGTCSVCCGDGGCNNDTCRNIRDRLFLDYRAGRLNMTTLRVVQP